MGTLLKSNGILTDVFRNICRNSLLSLLLTFSVGNQLRRIQIIDCSAQEVTLLLPKYGEIWKGIISGTHSYASGAAVVMEIELGSVAFKSHC